MAEYDHEVDCVFRLLNRPNSEELDIHQMNVLAQKIESLGMSPEAQQQHDDKPKEHSTSLTLAAKPAESKKVAAEVPGIKRAIKERFVKKVSSDIHLSKKESQKPGILHIQPVGPSSEKTLDPPKTKNPTFEIAAFPNKKKSINRYEFGRICEDDFVNQPLDEDILLKCFSMLDYNKTGYINPKVIRELFGIFDEKVDEDDTENLLRYLGCKGEMMNFEEFKSFFQKNL